jgi:multiple sugar transport system permease protein
MFSDTISGRKLRKEIFVFFASTLILVYVLAPIYWIINTSFQRESALQERPPYLIPNQGIFTLGHYEFIFTGVVPPDASVMIQAQHTMAGTLVYPAIINSLIVASYVTLVNVLIGFPAGQVFARYRFIGDKKVFLMLMATRLLPSIALVIPMFILLRSVGLLDSKIALVGVYSAITVPFTIWIMRAYFANIPVEYEEAARLDGCGYVRSLIKVVIPLARPGIIAAAIFAFMTSYSEFVFANILTQTINSKTQTVVLAALAGGLSASNGMIAAAATLSFLPPVLVAIIFRKQVLDGLTTRLGLS